MLAEEVARLLDDAGLGTYDHNGPTGNIFVNRVLDKPEALVALFETGGYAPDNDFSSAGIDRPTMQVRTRGRTLAVAYEKAYAIYDFLQTVQHVTLAGGTIVLYVSPLQPPGFIGWNASGLAEYTFNVAILIQRDARS
jgi:hypothetical protein